MSCSDNTGLGQTDQPNLTRIQYTCSALSAQPVYLHNQSIYTTSPGIDPWSGCSRAGVAY